MALIFMRILIFILFLPFGIHAQVILSGKIVENSSGKVIPFATIGLIKQNTGTNANEQGEFTISCKQPELDSLIISCIGYITIRLPVKNLGSSPVIELPVKEKRLKTIVIQNKWTYGEVGHYKGYTDYCLTSNGYQSQVAKKLTAPFANACLQAVNIRSSKNGGKSMIRIHVYDFDSVTKGPGEELTDTVIQASLKKGMNSIDLAPYQIYLPGKDFFVSVEWLLIPFNENRYSAMYEGKKQDFLNYYPCICFTKDPPSGTAEIWSLAYSGRWNPSFPNKKLGLAISATIKY